MWYDSLYRQKAREEKIRFEDEEEQEKLGVDHKSFPGVHSSQ